MAKRALLFLALAAASWASGCRTPNRVRDPEYAHLAKALRCAACASHCTATAPIVSELAGPHPVEDYIRAALAQNPGVQAARKKMEALAYQVPVAASLPDPMLNVTAQPEQVQTASGQQEAIVGASQQFHLFGKLDARACVAEAQTNVARAELAAVELAIIAKVKRAYYELYYLQRAISITEAEQQLLVEIRDVANTRYTAGNASQQDVLRADLEISNLENEWIQLRQQLASGRARLASLLHVSPQTPLAALDRLDEQRVPRDLEMLQQQAVSARPELHAKLAAICRDRANVRLARLDYKPDVTLGFSWIDVASAGISPVANGRDSFLVSAGVNLPIYRKRLDSSVRSAEAQVVATARQYDALRDGTLEQVTDLFAQAQSQEDLLTLFREDILPKARQTLEVSTRAYNVGEVDFLQLIDNWRQVLRYEVNYYRLRADQRQTLAELEQIVGGIGTAELVSLPAPDVEPDSLPVMRPGGDELR